VCKWLDFGTSGLDLSSSASTPNYKCSTVHYVYVYKVLVGGQMVGFWYKWTGLVKFSYGVASISRLLKIISLFCRISSLLYGSFAKETYNFKEPTSRSHPIVPPITSVEPCAYKVLVGVQSVQMALLSEYRVCRWLFWVCRWLCWVWRWRFCVNAECANEWIQIVQIVLLSGRMALLSEYRVWIWLFWVNTESANGCFEKIALLSAYRALVHAYRALWNTHWTWRRVRTVNSSRLNVSKLLYIYTYIYIYIHIHIYICIYIYSYIFIWCTRLFLVRTGIFFVLRPFLGAYRALSQCILCRVHIGLFRGLIGRFWGLKRLFRGLMGLFRVHIELFWVHRGLFWGYI